MPTLKVTLGIGFANARHEASLEIDAAAWYACDTDDDRERLIDQCALDWAWNYIDLGAELVE